MRMAVKLAVAGLVALLVALITGSTIVAVVVIALAIAGIILLLRDWRTEGRGEPDSGAAEDATGGEAESVGAGQAPASPDAFAPDIGTDSSGPSSDARAD